MSNFGRRMINADLFTEAYRVTGRVQIGTGGLSTELSNPNSNFLELEDAYISRINEPGKIVGSYSVASFRKDSINFIILQQRTEGFSSASVHSVFARGRPVSVFATAPSFEIQGETLYDGKSAPSAILVNSAGRFLPIFDATASASLYPDISYSGDLILLHKEQVGIFCLASDEK